MKIFNFFKKKKREKDEIHYCNKSEDSEEVKSIDIKGLENLMNEITSCNILILNKANEIINYMVDKKFRRVFKRINELHEIKDKILNLSRKMYGYETENEIVKICIDGITLCFFINSCNSAVYIISDCFIIFFLSDITLLQHIVEHFFTSFCIFLWM